MEILGTHSLSKFCMYPSFLFRSNYKCQSRNNSDEWLGRWMVCCAAENHMFRKTFIKVEFRVFAFTLRNYYQDNIEISPIGIRHK